MKVGRNDACPCGSGKKYKKCCEVKEKTLSVKPSNNPEIIDHHSVFDGEKWHKVPGSLSALIGIREEKDVHAEIDSLFLKITSQVSGKGAEQLLKKLDDCKHKLYAVKFHLKEIIREIQERVADFESNYSAGSGASFEVANHSLIYETEAFLFQVTSNLDLIVQALGHVVPSVKSFRTFNHSGEPGTTNYAAGGKLIKQLKQSEETDLANLFDSHRGAWIQEMTIMRDTITHYSGLRGFHCFIEEPYRGGEQVKVHYPTMPSGELVDEYCEKVYGQLCGLYQKVFEYIEKVATGLPRITNG